MLRDVVPPAKPLTSITIRDLTFDGNRSQNTGSYFSYSPELSIFTTSSVLITNCKFVESPNIPVGLYGAGASGIVVNNSTFSHNLIYGLWGGPTGNFGGHTYLDCARETFPMNVVVANNRFDRIGENAILGDFVGLQVIGNTFTNTYSYRFVAGVDWGGGGGQIDLTPCTQDAAVVRNRFEGGSAPEDPGLTPGRTGGIEVHGSDISIVDNTVLNNWFGGLALQGAADIFVANWDSTTGFLNNDNGAGIAISQGTENDTIRPAEFISIDSVIVVNNGGPGLWSATANQPINHLSVTRSCFQNNAAGDIQLSGLGNDVAIQSNPRAGCGSR